MWPIQKMIKNGSDLLRLFAGLSTCDKQKTILSGELLLGSSSHLFSRRMNKRFVVIFTFGLETLRKHLITATLILLPHLQSFRTGKKPQTIEGPSPTVDNITQIIARLEDWDEVESQFTFEKRVWSPVRPVVHLAFCIFFKLFGRLAPDTAGQSKTMFDIISPYPDEESLHDILRTSENVRSILPKLGHLRFTEDKTIQFGEAT
jgi:hypothetical protein